MEIEFDNAKATIIADTEEEVQFVLALREKTKVMVTGAEFTPAYYKWKKTKGEHGWDGKTTILSKAGVFPTGLLPEVMNWLWRGGKITPRLVDNRESNLLFSNSSIKLRDYQAEAINAGLSNKFNNIFWPRGVFHHATGAGKTQIAIAMYEMVPVKTLFIVDRKSLAQQTVERFDSYGIKCGKLYDKERDLNKKIVVATIQSLIAKQEEDEIILLLQNAEQVFFDEAHGIASSLAKGNTFVHVSNLMPNAFYRWGLTATPFLKDQYSNWLLAGATGDVLHSKPTSELIEEKVLVPPKIKILKAPKIFKCPNKWPDCYDAGIILNAGRTQQIVDELKTCPKPAFVLVKEISHMKIIDKACAGLNGTSLCGEDSLDERKNVLMNLENGKIDFIITTLFGVGTDFPSLATIIIAKGGKSEIASIQNVGRGLRNFKGKTEAYIVDWYDESCKTLKRHSEQRIATYESQGFEVRKAF